MNFGRILCPVNFSDQSAVALRTAGMLAKALKAELTVLHTQRWEFPPYFTVAQTKTLQSHLRRTEKAARRYFEDFAKQNLPDELPRTHVLVEEAPVAAILRLANELPADVIVMGTHGRTGWSRIRLGSVMQDVLRQARIPVLAVGPEVPGEKAKLGIRNVLCPVTFDDLSGATIEAAAFVAEKTGARLTALHVVEPAARREDTATTFEDRLCAWMSSAVNAQCSTRQVVREGSTVESIAREARKIRADLLVIGAKRRWSLGSIMFGTTTESLIRSTPCPVLVVAGSELGEARGSSAKAMRKEQHL